MTVRTRPATPADLDQVTTLLFEDATERNAADPDLWRLAPDARDRIRASVTAAMTAEKPPFPQQWLLAETENAILGVAHSILLPVPPIYAGDHGPPGLVMEDSFVAPGAPPRTRDDLLEAAEADLIGAGARILLASSVTGGAWETAYAGHGYAPLTAYCARTGLPPRAPAPHVRPATEADLPGIVAASAAHRRILDELHHLFWKPHPDADTRFAAWMKRSLTLQDRDMFVSDEGHGIGGYAISQPATPLHFPPPHDISGIGVIDDFHHDATADPRSLGASRPQAAALFAAAEAARAERGDHLVLVVCPATWQSKIDLLEQQGYRNAITWHIRMVG